MHSEYCAWYLRLGGERIFRHELVVKRVAKRCHVEVPCGERRGCVHREGWHQGVSRVGEWVP